jgi:hypothetical protein
MDRKIQDRELRLLCKVRLLVDTQIRANPNRKTNISDTRACLSKHCVQFRAKVVHEVSSTTGNLRAIIVCLFGLNELRIKFEPFRFATANTVQLYCGGKAFLVRVLRDFLAVQITVAQYSFVQNHYLLDCHKYFVIIH